MHEEDLMQHVDDLSDSEVDAINEMGREYAIRGLCENDQNGTGRNRADEEAVVQQAQADRRKKIEEGAFAGVREDRVHTAGIVPPMTPTKAEKPIHWPSRSDSDGDTDGNAEGVVEFITEFGGNDDKESSEQFSDPTRAGS
ncbi:hypothetical protein HK104_002880 [Borealophlyctis nickersoniae]|nr:hypothetical protein HK104_002880 [Borealophlyctis nickersoniae]